MSSNEKPATATDSETERFKAGQMVPPLVVVTYHHSYEAKPGIIHHSDPACKRVLREWFEDAVEGKREIVLHHAAYDLAVFAERFPDLRELIFAAVDKDGVTDTMIRQWLIDNAQGGYRGFVDERGKYHQRNYGLEDLCKRLLGIRLQKDAWRTSYGLFFDYPLEQWPVRAVEVQGLARIERAALAEKLTAHLAVKPVKLQDKPTITRLKDRLEALDEMLAGVPERATQYPLDDATGTLRVHQNQAQYSTLIKDQYRQTQAYFGLYLQSVWGLCTDGPGVELLERAIRSDLDETKELLIETGLVRENGVKDKKAAIDRMIEVCKANKLQVIRTDAHFGTDKKPPCPSQCTCGKTKCRDMNRKKGHSDVYEDFDHPQFCREHVGLDKDACEMVAEFDDVFADYSNYVTWGKVLTNDLVALKGAVDYPCHTRFGFAQTGRTTSCIAEGTPIQTPCDRDKYPLGRPIEDIKEGDWVYSYNQAGQLFLQRVLWAGHTGIKPLVELKWRAQGKGSLKLTADHRVMTLNGDWVEAGKLKPGDRLTAMSAREAASGYVKLYARGGVEHREHVFARAQTDGIAREAVHHIDHNKKNNDLSNLVGMTHSEHAKRHADEASAELTAKRFEELLDHYGLMNNHTVVSVTPAGEGRVYDLEVEHTHSFVAGEICVHNSKPNIQNQSKREGIREAFISRPGYVYIQCDYPMLELYTLAQCCVTWFGYSRLAEVLLKQQDAHLMVAAQIAKVDYETALKISKDKTHPQNGLIKKLRQQAKPFNFGKPGGMGVKTLLKTTRKQMGRKEFAKLDLDEAVAVKLSDEWKRTWPEMVPYFKRIEEMINDSPSGRVTVETLFTGRIRGNSTYCAALNNGFQALGSDCAKSGVWSLAKAAYVERDSPFFNSRPCAFVHDENIAETPYVPDEFGIDERAHAAAYELGRLMAVGANRWLPDVPIAIERMVPVMMLRWYKAAEPVYATRPGNDNDKWLVPAKAIKQPDGGYQSFYDDARVVLAQAA